MTNYKNNISMI